MIEISKDYPDICKRLTRLQVFVSDSIYKTLSRAIEEGKPHVTIRRNKLSAYRPQGALFYLIMRSQMAPMATDEYATYHRLVFRYGGLLHLHVIKCYLNPKQIIYMMPIDEEDEVIETVTSPEQEGIHG